MELIKQCPICFKFKLPGQFARQDANCPCKKCQGKYTAPGGAVEPAYVRRRSNNRIAPRTNRDGE